MKAETQIQSIAEVFRTAVLALSVSYYMRNNLKSQPYLQKILIIIGDKKMNYTIAKNNQFNSLEVNFSGKPCEAIRSALKNIGFRWHSVRRIWYGYTKM